MLKQNSVEWVEELMFNSDYNKKTIKEKLIFLDEIILKNKIQTKARQLGVTEFPYIERNSKNKITYFEQADGYWYKAEWHKCGYETLVLFNTGLYLKREFNDKGEQIYCETFGGVIHDARNEKPKKRGRKPKHI
jgi:hypothetical protein